MIVILFVISAIATLFLPGSTFKWAIMAGIAVPAFMNVELSPEFAQTIFRFGECVTMGLTPLATYYVIYLAYLENIIKVKSLSIYLRLYAIKFLIV